MWRGADVVIEHNVVEQADVGIFIDTPTTGVLLRDNHFKDMGQPVDNASGHAINI